MGKIPRKWRWMFRIVLWTLKLVMRIVKWIWPKK